MFFSLIGKNFLTLLHLSLRSGKKYKHRSIFTPVSILTYLMEIIQLQGMVLVERPLRRKITSETVVDFFYHCNLQ